MCRPRFSSLSLLLFVPLVHNPRGGEATAVEFLGLEAGDGGVGIGSAVKDDDAGLGTAGGEQEIEGEERNAGALEAADPFFGPPVDLLHGMGHEGLFGGIEVMIDGILHFADEGFVDVVALAGLKAEAGGVADIRALAEELLAALDPVVDDAVFARQVVEEAVDVALNDDVEVEEEGGALQIGQAVLEDEELDEDIRPAMEDLGIGVLREGLRIDALLQAGGVIGDADEAEGPMEVALDGGVEDVDIVRGISGAPFKADDIDRITHGLLLTFVLSGIQALPAGNQFTKSRAKGANGLGRRVMCESSKM